MKVNRISHLPLGDVARYVFWGIGGIVWTSFVWGQTIPKDIQQEVQRVRSDLSNQLQQGIDRSQDIPLLIGKIPLRVGEDISFEMLTNTGIPSDAEKRAIFSYAKLYETYIKDLGDLYTIVSEVPGSAGVFFAGLNRITKSVGNSTMNELAQLYNGKITFGDYSKRRKDIATNGLDSTKHLISTIQAANAAERAENERQWKDRQQAQERADQQRREQMQLDYERNRVRTTTCNRLGDFLFCQNQ